MLLVVRSPPRSVERRNDREPTCDPNGGEPRSDESVHQSLQSLRITVQEGEDPYYPTNYEGADHSFGASLGHCYCHTYK